LASGCVPGCETCATNKSLALKALVVQCRQPLGMMVAEQNRLDVQPRYFTVSRRHIDWLRK